MTQFQTKFSPFPSCGVAECFGLVRSCTSSSLLLFQYLSDALFVLLLDFSVSLLPDRELDLLSRPIGNTNECDLIYIVGKIKVGFDGLVFQMSDVNISKH